MTNSEFDSQFDILYNNIASNAAPSLTPYEKSVFLTQAQKDIIIGLYNGREVPGVSFESTEESRRYLSSLTKSAVPQYNMTDDTFTLPSDLWFITLEYFINNNERIKVVPVAQDELLKTLENPFKCPSKTRILREDIGRKVKLYKSSNNDMGIYTIHYLKTPEPIILEDLYPYNLSIEGKVEETTTDVDPILHKAILERAVYLAKVAYIGK